MAQESTLRGVISFLDTIGVYDIILPFLLVFTIMFAILEKTKILGTEKVGDVELTKKNLNAMIAFIVGFLVVASTRLVSIINQTLSHVVLLLILAVSFLLLVGVFFGSKEFTLESYPGWIKFLMVVMFVSIVLILLNALGWLTSFTGVFTTSDSQWGSGLVVLIVIIFLVWYIIKDPKNPPTETKD